MAHPDFLLHEHSVARYNDWYCCTPNVTQGKSLGRMVTVLRGTNGYAFCFTHCSHNVQRLRKIYEGRAWKVTKVLKAIWVFLKSETTRKFVVECVAEIVATVVSKLISGGGSAPHYNLTANEA